MPSIALLPPADRRSRSTNAAAPWRLSFSLESPPA
jgi:hypothetical protein